MSMSSQGNRTLLKTVPCTDGGPVWTASFVLDDLVVAEGGKDLDGGPGCVLVFRLGADRKCVGAVRVNVPASSDGFGTMPRLSSAGNPYNCTRPVL